jgi:hypothetical protein
MPVADKEKTFPVEVIDFRLRGTSIRLIREPGTNISTLGSCSNLNHDRVLYETCE